MNNLEALEVKVAFLEESVTSLSDEYFLQQKEIEELKKQMSLLFEKLRNVRNSDQEQLEVHDERPPHY